MSKQIHNTLNEQDLEVALQALRTSAVVIYYKFQIIFKILGLMILAYISYRFGRVSVSEPIAKKAKNIEKQIKKIQNQKQELPTRIKQISSIYIKIVIFSILLIAGAGAAVYLKHIKINPLHLSPLLIVPFVLYMIKSFHIASLKEKGEQFTLKEKKIREDVKQLNDKLGKKVQGSLKNILCIDKLKAKQNISSSYVCNKKDCQQLREAYKIRYETIRTLAESALQFQWCSTCKNRKLFDELVRFQAKPMPAHGDDISEQEDADMKINYLLEVLEEIDRWIQQAGPCNCSKLYMEEVLTSRKQTAKTLKEIAQKISYLEDQKKNSTTSSTATIIRADSRTSAPVTATQYSNSKIINKKIQ